MVKVQGTLRDALIVLQAELAKDEPVLVREAVSKTWTVFTDGAYEPDGWLMRTVWWLSALDWRLEIVCFIGRARESIRCYVLGGRVGLCWNGCCRLVACHSGSMHLREWFKQFTTGIFGAAVYFV